MDECEGVLFAAEIVEGDVGVAIELFEGIEDEEGGVHGLAGKSLGGGIGMKVLRLHLEGAGCGLELGLVNGGGELAGLEIEVPIPHLRLPFARVLAGEVAAQGVLVFLEDARHKAGTDWERLVLKSLRTLCEVDDLFQLQSLEVHDGYRGIDEGPSGAFARLHIIGLRHDVGAITDADEFGIVRAFDARRRGVHQTLQDEITRQSRVPAAGEDALGMKGKGKEQEKQRKFIHGNEGVENILHHDA